MKRQECFSQILEARLIPAVRTRTAEQAVRAIKALKMGGLTVFEVPLTVPGALDVLRAAKDWLSKDALLGAGTVLDAEAARCAILAGADFLVSPSLTLDVIEVGHSYDIPVFCGALTPTEILSAWRGGSDCVKVFPAAAVGGPSYIKAIKAPLPQMVLMPMGGVNLENAAEFLNAGASLLGVGNDLVDNEALERKDDSALATKAERYVELIHRHARAEN